MRLLTVALVVLLCGLGGAAWAFGRWALLGFGPIQVYDVLRILVLSLTAIAVAVQ